MNVTTSLFGYGDCKVAYLNGETCEVFPLAVSTQILAAKLSMLDLCIYVIYNKGFKYFEKS